MKHLQDSQQGKAFVLVFCSIVSVWALINEPLTPFSVTAETTAIRLLQGQEREILLARQAKKDPLEISLPRVEGEAVRFGEKFVAKDDQLWLKQATFKIQNRYSKPITYVQINVDFPEIFSNAIMMQHQIFLGRHPVYKSPANLTLLKLRPGESVEVSFATEYAAIKHMVEFTKQPVERVSKLLIRLSEVGFEDGTLYSGGDFYRRNPDPDGQPKWLLIVE